MSSILIKGAKMPAYCCQCPCYDGEYGVCRVDKFKNISNVDLFEKRPEDCAIKEIVVPHGRLIDADELVDLLRKEVCLGCGIGMEGAAFSQRCLGCVTLTMYGIVNNLAKTIIEEEM